MSSSETIIPPEIRKLLGPPPLLSTEDAQIYEAILAEHVRLIKPRDVIEWLRTKRLVDQEWEARRLKHFKPLLIEETHKARAKRAAEAAKAAFVAGVWRQRLQAAATPAVDQVNTDANVAGAANAADIDQRRDAAAAELEALAAPPTTADFAAAAPEWLKPYEQLTQLDSDAEKRHTATVDDMVRYREGRGLHQIDDEIIDGQFEEVPARVQSRGQKDDIRPEGDVAGQVKSAVPAQKIAALPIETLAATTPPGQPITAIDSSADHLLPSMLELPAPEPAQAPPDPAVGLQDDHVVPQASSAIEEKSSDVAAVEALDVPPESGPPTTVPDMLAISTEQAVVSMPDLLVIEPAEVPGAEREPGLQDDLQADHSMTPSPSGTSASAGADSPGSMPRPIILSPDLPAFAGRSAQTTPATAKAAQTTPKALRVVSAPPVQGQAKEMTAKMAAPFPPPKPTIARPLSGLERQLGIHPLPPDPADLGGPTGDEAAPSGASGLERALGLGEPVNPPFVPPWDRTAAAGSGRSRLEPPITR